MKKDLPVVEINDKKYIVEDFEKNKRIYLKEVSDKYNNTLSIKTNKDGVLMTAFSELIGNIDGVYYAVRLKKDNQNNETYQYSNEGYIGEWNPIEGILEAYEFIKEDISNLRETEKIMQEREQKDDKKEIDYEFRMVIYKGSIFKRVFNKLKIFFGIKKAYI